MSSKIITVGSDFSRFPAGRTPLDGPYCGEKFRKEILMPALREYDSVIVDLSGTVGYGSSFLEEVFGGLYRESSIDDAMINKLQVTANDRHKKFYVDRVRVYMEQARAQAKR